MESQAKGGGDVIDDFEFLRLWDLYSPLLTEKQREITALYFEYDLSLGEIAEQRGVSRQSVSDCLHKCKKQLSAYEEKLGLSKILQDGDRAFSAYMTTVVRWISAQRQAHPEWESELAALEKRLDETLEEHGVEPVKE